MNRTVKLVTLLFAAGWSMACMHTVSVPVYEMQQVQVGTREVAVEAAEPWTWGDPNEPVRLVIADLGGLPEAFATELEFALDQEFKKTSRKLASLTVIPRATLLKKVRETQLHPLTEPKIRTICDSVRANTVASCALIPEHDSTVFCSFHRVKGTEVVLRAIKGDGSNLQASASIIAQHLLGTRAAKTTQDVPIYEQRRVEVGTKEEEQVDWLATLLLALLIAGGS